MKYESEMRKINTVTKTRKRITKINGEYYMTSLYQDTFIVRSYAKDRYGIMYIKNILFPKEWIGRKVKIMVIPILEEKIVKVGGSD